MLASILAFFTALFNGGITKVGKGLEWVASLFQPTLEEKKAEISKQTGDESKDLDRGGRPHWDD